MDIRPKRTLWPVCGEPWVPRWLPHSLSRGPREAAPGVRRCWLERFAHCPRHHLRQLLALLSPLWSFSREPGLVPRVRMLRVTHPFPRRVLGGRGGGGRVASSCPCSCYGPCHPHPTPQTRPRSLVSLKETQQLGQNAPPDAHPLLIIWKQLQCIKENPLGASSHLLLYF